MVPVSRRAILAGLATLGSGAALGLGGCSPLSVFEAVTPQDADGVLVARDLAFGSNPRQKLDIYAPKSGAAGAPVALFIYGGSWSSGSKDLYGFVGSALASRGFVTVIADYRLYPEVRFPDFLDDGAAAIRWIRDHIASFGGDPRRFVIVGHSAGAYNAAMLALAPGYLRRAGVDPRMVRAFAGLSGPYDFLPLDDESTINTFGAWPDKAQTQPITFARRGAPAAFLATGDQDTTVRPRNTASLAAHLRKAGGRVTERVYPGLDHKDTALALSRLFRGKAPVLDDVTRFLRASVGA